VQGSPNLSCWWNSGVSIFYCVMESVRIVIIDFCLQIHWLIAVWVNTISVILLGKLRNLPGGTVVYTRWLYVNTLECVSCMDIDIDKADINEAEGNHADLVHSECPLSRVFWNLKSGKWRRPVARLHREIIFELFLLYEVAVVMANLFSRR